MAHLVSAEDWQNKVGLLAGWNLILAIQVAVF